jgi:ATP-binding cassette subfamily F protein 3
MIYLTDITLYRGTKELLRNANLQLQKGEKLGIVGRNGCGKSSLFQLLLGNLIQDAGDLSMPVSLRVAHMLQETTASSRTAVDYVLDGHKEYRRHQAALLHAEKTHDEIGIASCHDALQDLNAWELQNKAEQLLSGLGFSTRDFLRHMSEFSGGWRIRLNLAQALIQPSDLLLLDEPTNHLDLEAMLWLQNWLQRYQGTLLLISHDRYFLDQIVGGILSFEKQKLLAYNGNYTKYEKQRAERLAQHQQVYEKQQYRKAQIEDFVRRFRAKATKARQAQSRLKELERMVEIEPAHVDSPFQFEFREPLRLPQTLVTLENYAIGYDKPLFQDFSATIRGTDRIGLLGPNGQGKSTFLKTLVGQLEALNGKLYPSEHLRIGYCAQHQTDVLDTSASPLQLIQRLDPKVHEQDFRDFLGSFDFQGELVDSAIAPLSGGEKSRLALALVAWQRPNLLILDEPTNHLDLEMVHALTRALQSYGGALLLVSHDRHLLNNTVDSFLLVRDGKVNFFEGSLEDYEMQLTIKNGDKSLSLPKKIQKKSSNFRNLQEKNNSKRGAFERQQAAQRRTELKPLKDKLSKLEIKLDDIHKKLEFIKTSLADSNIYEISRKDELSEMLKQQGELKNILSTTEEEWLLVSSEMEAIQAY